jgi:cell division protein FtsN
MNTPIGRDFKRSNARTGLSQRLTREHWQGFGVGLTLGLILTMVALSWAQSRLRSETSTVRPSDGEATTDPGDTESAVDAAAQYEFYDRLKNLEVVVPDPVKDTGPDLPTSLIERPGTYVIELGNWRDVADADRTRAKVARLGITASQQRVTIDSVDFHRVQVGPFSKLDELNRIRMALSNADITAEAIRVGD